MIAHDRIEDGEASGCPAVGARAGADGCPVSPRAEVFDPFDRPYHVDLGSTLEWARDEEPVFYSPKLGYWVVTRFDDVKAVFRDNHLFSPRIALEKITPMSQEAQDILRRSGYNMQRTLVNADEPDHMERRRLLMDSFAPEELARHEPMVRRLTRAYVDGFIDKGEVDLVKEMLWDIPLTVALHFLGVPDDDRNKLRAYSIAHTVNIWGRPTRAEERRVAENVGKFWQYAGEVLEKMRRDPSGPGWMEYAIRRQRDRPDVITDTFLHSMMQAIIVAAHETTAHASANMLRALLERPAIWEELCDNPDLIPNTVEECLRYAGSVVAWRRQAMADTQIGGVSVPEGAKLLIVQASANHDRRHFDNPEDIDIYRENTADQLTFGYGAHQCLGKNIARMEMRIFLEEFVRRLPHMELAPQDFSFIPNIAFRGPEHLWVRWDPEQNPERRDPGVREQARRFSIGAPNKADIARRLRVARLAREADSVLDITLAHPWGKPMLPRWAPGSHITLRHGGYQRAYSLCGDPEDHRHFRIAVLREEQGRGGSAYLHDTLAEGTEVEVQGPRNHFRLNEDLPAYVLIAGGIGITPIVAMADRLKHLGKRYELHYCGRRWSRMAFLDRLRRNHGHALHLYASAETGRPDLAAIVRRRGPAHIYACGPEGMLDELAELTADCPDILHVEHFTAGQTAGLDPDREIGFDAELTDSEVTIPVRADQTVLEALRAHGVDVPSDCEEGLCGTCAVEVVAGEIDHRDRVLTRDERARGERMMACCSRSRGGAIKLRL